MPAKGETFSRPPVPRGADSGEDTMRDEYDFSNASPNPFASVFPKQSITIRLDDEALVYFKSLSDELGMPYQSLINFYLRECAQNKLRPKWC
jgi:predicted DNA binding CopG/RHH family protein